MAATRGGSGPPGGSPRTAPRRLLPASPALPARRGGATRPRAPTSGPAPRLGVLPARPCRRPAKSQGESARLPPSALRGAKCGEEGGSPPPRVIAPLVLAFSELYQEL